MQPPCQLTPILLILSVGCSGDALDDTAEEAGVGFSVLADGIPEGTLMSAWTDSGEMLVVGGELGRSGFLLRYDGERLCVESDVADGAIWWIHGPADGEWYAVGDHGLIVHERDGKRTREDVPTSSAARVARQWSQAGS